LCLGVAWLAAAGILTATAATRLPPPDTAAQAPSINVNRAAKTDRQLSSGGSTIVVKAVRISRPPDASTTPLRELPACEASISPLADRSAGRHLRAIAIPSSDPKILYRRTDGPGRSLRTDARNST
jgi:hypothetical protein